MASSCQYAEKTSSRRKTVEHTYGAGSITMAQRERTAADRRPARPSALLGGRLRRYWLVYLLRSGHPLWTSRLPLRFFCTTHHVGVCPAHPQVFRSEVTLSRR